MWSCVCFLLCFVMVECRALVDEYKSETPNTALPRFMALGMLFIIFIIIIFVCTKNDDDENYTMPNAITSNKVKVDLDKDMKINSNASHIQGETGDSNIDKKVNKSKNSDGTKSGKPKSKDRKSNYRPRDKSKCKSKSKSKSKLGNSHHQKDAEKTLTNTTAELFNEGTKTSGPGTGVRTAELFKDDTKTSGQNAGFMTKLFGTKTKSGGDSKVKSREQTPSRKSARKKGHGSKENEMAGMITVDVTEIGNNAQAT